MWDVFYMRGAGCGWFLLLVFGVAFFRCSLHEEVCWYRDRLSRSGVRLVQSSHDVCESLCVGMVGVRGGVCRWWLAGVNVCWRGVVGK